MNPRVLISCAIVCLLVGCAQATGRPETPSPQPPPTANPGIVETEQVATAATETSAASPQPAAPLAILSFQPNAAEADPGDEIILEWASTGATGAMLYHLPPSGQLPQSGWDVPPSGTYAYQIPADARNISQFSLYVYDEAENGAWASTHVDLRCPTAWFFAPALDGCGSEPRIRSGAEQHFQHGTMIWVESPWGEGQDAIFVLYDDVWSPRWAMFADEWEEGLPDHDPSLTSPAGLYQPMRGFGLVWREHPEVRDRLGWATDQEAPFTTTVQTTTLYKYNTTYVGALDGNVWELAPEHSDWTKIAVD